MARAPGTAGPGPQPSESAHERQAGPVSARPSVVSALSQLLARLGRMRPPPGAAAAAVAVPAPGEELTGEVAFLFARLDAVEHQGEELLAAARADAHATETAAREHGRQLVEHARTEGAAVAAQLHAQRAAAAERQAQAMILAAQHEAERVLTQGRARIPAFAHSVAERVAGQES